MDAADDRVVLVGAGSATDRSDDPAATDEALVLMGRALRAALDDAASGDASPVEVVTLDADRASVVARAAELAARVGWIGVPEGTWGYRDPGRLLAATCTGGDSTRAAAIHTVVADVGILQQQLVDHAIEAVRSGRTEVAVVVGGEAKHRALRSAITGTPAPETGQDDDVVPDERLTPGSITAVGVHEVEILRNTVTPVAAYALIENALGHALGRSPGEHRDAVAAVQAQLAAVAADNPEAWDRAGWRAADIRDPGPGNRMISTPYTKRHSAQWNVDQAAALVFCAEGLARELGLPERQWVHPHASTVANHAVAVVERDEIGRCVGAEVAAPRVLELAGVGLDAVAHLDLYSCFPSAVELLADALGLPLDDPRGLSVTGGLAFAGGPLNNYVLQALVALVRRLRGDPGSLGLSSSVSGFLVKQGFSLWSTRPPATPFVAEDVTPAVAAAAVTRPVVTDHDGPGTIASWTVDWRDGAPERAVAIVDVDAPGSSTARPARTIAESRAAPVVDALLAGDPIGRRVAVAGGTFTLAG